MVEIFTGRMEYLFSALLEDPALVHLLQQLLMQPTISRHVAPILMQYLVDSRLTNLQEPSSKVSLAADRTLKAAAKLCLLQQLLMQPTVDHCADCHSG